MGSNMQFSNEITALDPTRRFYDDRALSGTFLIQSSWQVEPNNHGSHLTWITQFQPKGLMTLLTPILRRAIRKGQLDDLAKLKQLVEQPD